MEGSDFSTEGGGRGVKAWLLLLQFGGKLAFYPKTTGVSAQRSTENADHIFRRQLECRLRYYLELC